MNPHVSTLVESDMSVSVPHCNKHIILKQDVNIGGEAVCVCGGGRNLGAVL